MSDFKILFPLIGNPGALPSLHSYRVIFGFFAIVLWLSSSLHAEEPLDARVASIIQEYRDAAAEAPNDPQAQGQLGIVLELHGHLQEAIDQYELAASLDVQEPRWYYYQALILANHFDRAKAQDLLVKAMNIEPTYLPGWLYRGTWYLQLDEPAQALAAFERAQELGANLPAVAGRAQAKLALGRADEVIEEITQFEVERLHPMLKHLLAQAYMRTGDIKRGRGLLRNVHTIPAITWQDPWIDETGKFKGDTLSRRLDYSQLLFGMNKREDALQVLQDLVSIYPNNRKVLFNLSIAYHVNNQPDEALQMLQRGIELFPDYYPYHTSIANLYKLRGDVDQALQHLDQAIEIDANVPQAFEQKGQIMMEAKDWEQARLNFAIARRLEPTNPNVLVYLGMSLGMQDEWLQASYLFKEAILIDKGFVPAYVNLARALSIQTKFDEARSIVAELEAMGAPEANVQTLLGQIATLEELRR